MGAGLEPLVKGRANPEYPRGEDGVIDLGGRHFAMHIIDPITKDVVGLLWWHDCTVEKSSWSWLGRMDGRESGHRIVSSNPLYVEGSLICMACKDHGFIRDGAWVNA